MDVDSSSKFIGSLTKFLQSLCNGYVEFQRGVELCGHIYLSIDTGEKVDYILHEKVSKNDENSVTFVSNSFHAQPLSKDKEKEKPSDNDSASKPGPVSRVSKDTSGDDDDDDIMIVDQQKGVPGSTNSGTIPSKGVKRAGSPSSDHRQAQRIRNAAGSLLPRSQGSSSSSSNTMVSPPRNAGNRPQPGGPAATITSQDAAQENLNMVDLKLEQITRDELLSLASQVGEGGSGPSNTTASASRPHPRPQPQRAGAVASVNSAEDTALWIKQEVAEDNGTGDSDEVWSHGRDDSNSNSGSNLYPVMLHQNTAAYSNPVFPGFSGSNTSGTSSAANLYANPLPGTSQDMSGLDPSVSSPMAVCNEGLEPWTGNGKSSDNKELCRITTDGHFLSRPQHAMLEPVINQRSAFANDPAIGSMINTFRFITPAKPCPSSWGEMSQRQRKVVMTRLWREKMKQNPQQYRLYRQKQQQYVRKYRAKRKSLLEDENK